MCFYTLLCSSDTDCKTIRMMKRCNTFYSLQWIILLVYLRNRFRPVIHQRICSNWQKKWVFFVCFLHIYVFNMTTCRKIFQNHAPPLLLFSFLCSGGPTKKEEKKNTSTDCPIKKKLATNKNAVSTPQVPPSGANHQEDTAIKILAASTSKTCRVYDKRNYCLFCSKATAKIAQHLETVHKKIT